MNRYLMIFENFKNNIDKFPFLKKHSKFIPLFKDLEEELISGEYVNKGDKVKVLEGENEGKEGIVDSEVDKDNYIINTKDGEIIEEPFPNLEVTKKGEISSTKEKEISQQLETLFTSILSKISTLNNLKINIRDLNTYPEDFNYSGDKVTTEVLQDLITYLGNIERTNKWIKLLPSKIRKEAKSNSTEINNILGEFDDYDLYKNFLKKSIKWSYNDYIKELKKLIDSQGTDYALLVKQLYDDDGIDIIYNEDNIILTMVFSLKSSQKFGSSNWCISYQNNPHWKTYVKPGDRAVQYFLWDYNRGSSDPYHKIAYTVGGVDRVSDAHDSNDKSIINRAEFMIMKRLFDEYDLNKSFSNIEKEQKIKYCLYNKTYEKKFKLLGDMDSETKKNYIEQDTSLIETLGIKGLDIDFVKKIITTDSETYGFSYIYKDDNTNGDEYEKQSVLDDLTEDELCSILNKYDFSSLSKSDKDEIEYILNFLSVEDLQECGFKPYNLLYDIRFISSNKYDDWLSDNYEEYKEEYNKISKGTKVYYKVIGKYSKSKEDLKSHSENNWYFFIAKDEFIELDNGNFKKELDIEKMIKIDVTDPNETRQVNFMLLRVKMASDSSKLYKIYLPKQYYDEPTYSKDEIDEEMMSLIKTHMVDWDWRNNK